MAKIGLNNFRYGVLTENNDGTYSYAGATKPAKAVECSVEITNNDARLYADDALAESDYTFSGGTATITIDDDDQTTMAALLGHTVSDGAMVRRTDDVAPYVGFGRIVTKIVGGVYKYKVEFLMKVKFSEPSQDDTTKGENVEFSTTEIQGAVSALENGEWSKSKTFSSKTDAVAYLESLLNTGTAAEVTLSYGSGSGLIESIDGYVGQTVNLPTGDSITPPSGKHFIGWDTTSGATVPDLSTSYTIAAAAVTLYAVYANNE